MTCPNCKKELADDVLYCPYCGTIVSPDAPLREAQPAPRKRNTFLGVFSFIFSLISAWTTFVSVFVERTGFFAGAPQQVQGMFSYAGTFFCIVAAVLAFFSLFGRNIKRGLGAFGLILSLACLAVLQLPVTGLRPNTAETVKKPAIVTSVPTAAASPSEKDEAKTVLSDTNEDSTRSQTIAAEDVYLTVERVNDATYRLTIDNRSDRAVNFGWVNGCYALLTTDAGKIRGEISESQFAPVKPYTSRTLEIAFEGASGAVQSLELIDLYHLDVRGLPSLGRMEGLLFCFDE